MESKITFTKTSKDSFDGSSADLYTIDEAAFIGTAQHKFEWVCNECNFPNFTSSVSEEEIEQELHACINCGGFEFHKKNI